jgi:hypothetical protein
VASLANYLGLQDAARKCRDPSRSLGPRTGSIVCMDGGLVEVSMSQECWDKAKRMIFWIRDAVRESDTIDFKPLESYRGFLICISRTYPAITPYLKVIHLTLDSWRPWKDDDAWKLPLSEIKIALALKDTNNIPTNEMHDKPPLKVKVAPRLHDDTQAFVHLFSDEEPPKRTIRPNKCAEAMYMFGDASGSGFGSSLMIEHEIH